MTGIRDFPRGGGWLVAVVIPICIVLIGCQRLSSDRAADIDHRHAVPVVATHSILGDWVRQVGGDHVNVTILVGPGGDAHTYEPTPKDSVALEQARVVFENGLGFEVWLNDLCEPSQTEARRCVVSRQIPPRTIDGTAGEEEVDPHVWQSPHNAILMVQAIADELAEVDPVHSAEYRKHAQDYIQKLRSLDADIKDQVIRLSPERRILVTTHDTFGYFADAYGFQVFSVLGSVSSESSDPSAREVAMVIRRIREFQVPAVFTENILNPKLTEQVANEAGVKIIPTLYTDALGTPGSPGSDYLGMMRFNVRTIVEALR